MTRPIALFLCWSACGTPLPTGPAQSNVSLDLARVDVRGTAASIAAIATDLADLDPASADLAAESLRILSVTCPYTRTALQLPFVMHQAVQAIDPEQLDRLVQADWVFLEQGLSTHVAVLTALQVDLSAPAPGDPLHGRAPGLLVDRDTLLASDDPIAATQRLIAQTTSLAEQLDGPALARIAEHSDRLEQITGVVRMCPRGPHAAVPGHPWTLGAQLAGWHDALRRVRPFVHDAATAEVVDALIELMDTHGVQAQP